MGIRLTVDDGSSNPRTYSFEVGQVASLGRHGTNTVVLADEHVSRSHAVVLWDTDRWILQETGTPANGTRISGKPIKGRAELQDGNEIGIGDIVVRVAISDQLWPATACVDWSATPPPADAGDSIITFLRRAVEAPDYQALIRLALDTVTQWTDATVAAYLSLDTDAQPKTVLPENGHVDVLLSRRLTQQVLNTGQSVLASTTSAFPLTDSLQGFTDALCVPVRANLAGDATGQRHAGALHLYRKSAQFLGNHRRFVEVIASCLPGYLMSLRERRRLEADNARLKVRAAGGGTIIGGSPVMQTLRGQITRAAASRSTVLVRGETGVGKELVALALHQQSDRCDGPLVVVNCATLSGTLVEAELFGHRKGAFTGAERDRPGLFEQADEGTLFLDEVGDLPQDCQAKVLRIIEGHGFRPVGATGEIRVDVRVVAATNRNLEEDVKRGTFRRDLLYRLQVIQISVPPLRDRAEDIPALAEAFLAKLGRRGRASNQLAGPALDALRAYAWPGNVRQLLAVLESAAAMSETGEIGATDLYLPEDDSERPLNMEQLEAWAVRQALQRTKGNISQAAKILGINRETVSVKMKHLGIVRDSS